MQTQADQRQEDLRNANAAIRTYVRSLGLLGAADVWPRYALQPLGDLNDPDFAGFQMHFADLEGDPMVLEIPGSDGSMSLRTDKATYCLLSHEHLKLFAFAEEIGSRLITDWTFPDPQEPTPARH